MSNLNIESAPIPNKFGIVSHCSHFKFHYLLFLSEIREQTGGVMNQFAQNVSHRQFRFLNEILEDIKFQSNVTRAVTKKYDDQTEM